MSIHTILSQEIEKFDKKFVWHPSGGGEYWYHTGNPTEAKQWIKSFVTRIVEECKKENEVWVDIQGFEGRYQVSNMGNVRSLFRVIVRGNKKSMTIDPKTLSKITDSHGYYLVNLAKDGVISHSKIHRLVADAFIKNTFNKKYINHKDGVKTNNCVTNLEWVTPKENVQHAIKIGLMGKNWKLQKMKEI